MPDAISTNTMSEGQLDYAAPPDVIRVKSGSAGEDVHFSMFHNDLPKALTENVLRELNETEENRTKGIESLKEFLRKKELRSEDEELLIWVLRNCKYDIKRSKNKLERFLRTRRMVGRKLAQVPMSVVEDALNALSFGHLPYRDKHGRIIVFIKPILQVRNFDTDLLASLFLSCVMFILTLPMTSVHGAAYIGDSKDMSVFLIYPTLKVYKTFALHIFQTEEPFNPALFSTPPVILSSQPNYSNETAVSMNDVKNRGTFWESRIDCHP